MTQDKSWVSFFRELTEALLSYENKQEELIKILIDIGIEEQKLIDKTNTQKDEIVKVTDPLSFISLLFLQEHKKETRLDRFKELRNIFKLSTVVIRNPMLPIIQNKPWFIPHQKDGRKPDDVEILWTLTKQILQGDIAQDVFDRALKIKNTKVGKITTMMFILNPQKYFVINNGSIPYLQFKRIMPPGKMKQLNFETYLKILARLKKIFPNQDFIDINEEAYFWKENNKQYAKELIKTLKEKSDNNYADQEYLLEIKNNENEETLYKKIGEVPISKIREEIKKESQKNGKKAITTKRYERNPKLALYIKQFSKGKCMLCCKDAPFWVNNHPFLESHHIKFRSENGEDVLENLSALCPNCHRKMHLLQTIEDINKLVEKNKEILKEVGL